MKFLKKDVSEANAVAGVVDRIALSHPEVSFRFIRDGREELLTPGDSQLRSCIYAVLGKEFSDSLLPVDYTLGRRACPRLRQQTRRQPRQPHHAALFYQRPVRQDAHRHGRPGAG